MDSKITIGGQAVIEGVMMRSQNKYAVCVRNPKKKISTKIISVNKKHSWFSQLPIVRGCFRFAESMIIGIQSLEWSATESQGEEEGSIKPLELFTMFAASIGITIVLFYMIPLFLTRILTDKSGIVFNLIDGALRILIFILYLLLISLFPDIKRVFQYHGAEHKTVSCFESKQKLTVANVQKFSTFHPRCGTSFVLIVFVFSILLFSLVGVEGYFPRLGLRLLMLPVIAGISYETLRFSAKHSSNILVKILIAPGLWLQRITTKQPTDDMVEVAIASLKAAL
ncbi:MAG: DUF1385 domain-containing protein [archaeon]